MRQLEGMKQLEAALKRMDLPCGPEVLEKFETYRRRVLEWNEAVNLTAIKDPVEFEVKHFIDSLVICEDGRMRNASRIMDVGTGAGFPGIPLAIVFPEKRFTLMDSLGKRMKIVRELSDEIGLNHVEILHARAEELARKKEYREQYDLCVSRAVANLAVLSEYCIPFVKPGGWFAPYKTSAAEAEIREAGKAVKLLGGELKDKTTFSDSREIKANGESLEHMIVWIEKKCQTVAKYPRKAGTPAKDPLK